jgi:hypothetical protein
MVGTPARLPIPLAPEETVKSLVRISVPLTVLAAISGNTFAFTWLEPTD